MSNPRKAKGSSAERDVVNWFFDENVSLESAVKQASDSLLEDVNRFLIAGKRVVVSYDSVHLPGDLSLAGCVAGKTSCIVDEGRLYQWQPTQKLFDMHLEKMPG